jgi:hypothetical protein
MSTKAEIIEIIKAENPTIQVGSDEQGYTQLSATDYETQIAEWAEGRLAKEAKLAEAAQSATNKAALLAKLGISQDDLTTLLS